MYNTPNLSTVLTVIPSFSLPVICMPAGNFTTVDGALTLGTPIVGVTLNTRTYTVYMTNSGGLSVAGLYSCVFSSTTVCQLYNLNTLVKPTTTMTAYTPVTLSWMHGVSVTIPGGAMGNNGTANIYYLVDSGGTGGNRNTAIYFGGVQVHNYTLNNAGPWGGTAIRRLKNRGSSSEQVCFTGNTSGSIGVAGAYNAAQILNVNTASNVLAEVYFYLNSTADYVILHDFAVEIISDPQG
jgi:hypothetical protein